MDIQKRIWERSDGHDDSGIYRIWQQCRAVSLSVCEEQGEYPEIQVVVINVPEEWHVYYAKMALEHGKHILVEKPFAPSAAEAEGVFRLADSKGLGAHTLDQMIALFGKPQRVRYDVRGIINPDGGKDFFDIELYYGTMKISVKTTLFAKIQNPRFLVHGKRGSFLKMSQGHLSHKSSEEPGEALYEREAEAGWGTVSVVDEYGNDLTYKVPSEITDYGRLYDDLYDAVIHGKEKLVRKEEVLEVLRILETAKKKTDRWD